MKNIDSAIMVGWLVRPMIPLLWAGGCRVTTVPWTTGASHISGTHWPGEGMPGGERAAVESALFK